MHITQPVSGATHPLTTSLSAEIRAKSAKLKNSTHNLPLARGCAPLWCAPVMNPTISGSLNTTTTRAYVKQLAVGLNDLHKRGVSHNDLKPANVIVVNSQEGPVLKFIDLNLSTAMAHMGDLQAPTGGTPAYQAPEQCCDQAKLDCRVDVWALGILLLQFRLGNVPAAFGLISTAADPMQAAAAAVQELQRSLMTAPHRWQLMSALLCWRASPQRCTGASLSAPCCAATPTSSVEGWCVMLLLQQQPACLTCGYRRRVSFSLSPAGVLCRVL